VKFQSSQAIQKQKKIPQNLTKSWDVTVFMLDSWVHASIESGGVTETSKVVHVLLPLGGKQHSYVQGHMLCLHYTLCLMQLSVVRNLIFTGFSDDSPWVDY
jgi:hypothetical protein